MIFVHFWTVKLKLARIAIAFLLKISSCTVASYILHFLIYEFTSKFWPHIIVTYIASCWSVSSNLSFNCVKFAVLHFWCNSNNTAQYVLDNNIIDSLESIKDLGIMISSDLSGSTDCKMAVSRVLGLVLKLIVSVKKNYICDPAWQKGTYSRKIHVFT